MPAPRSYSFNNAQDAASASRALHTFWEKGERHSNRSRPPIQRWPVAQYVDKNGEEWTKLADGKWIKCADQTKASALQSARKYWRQRREDWMVTDEGSTTDQDGSSSYVTAESVSVSNMGSDAGGSSKRYRRRRPDRLRRQPQESDLRRILVDVYDTRDGSRELVMSRIPLTVPSTVPEDCLLLQFESIEPSSETGARLVDVNGVSSTSPASPLDGIDVIRQESSRRYLEKKQGLSLCEPPLPPAPPSTLDDGDHGQESSGTVVVLQRPGSEQPPWQREAAVPTPPGREGQSRQVGRTSGPSLYEPAPPPPTPVHRNSRNCHVQGAKEFFTYNQINEPIALLARSMEEAPPFMAGPPPLRLDLNGNPLEGDQIYTPEEKLQGWIGLEVHLRSMYAILHGSSNGRHRFGKHVHAGLLCLAHQRMPYETTSRKALWILYGISTNFQKDMQGKPYGTHPLDRAECMWFPGTGHFVPGIGWFCRCIGQEWRGEKGWWVHESRIRVVDWTETEEFDSYSDGTPQSDEPWGDVMIPGLPHVVNEDQMMNLQSAPHGPTYLVEESRMINRSG